MSFKKARSWEHAESQSLGYGHEEIANVYAKKKPEVHLAVHSPKIRERKAILLGFLASFADSRQLPPIKILDIGGGNGYFLSWILEQGIRVDKYFVLESEIIANLYREKYSNNKILKFISNLPTNDTFDLIVLSCTLQYLKNDLDVLKLAQKQSKNIILMRHPITREQRTVYAVQTIENHEETGVTVSWPLRIFPEDWVRRNLIDGFYIKKEVSMSEEWIEIFGQKFEMSNYLLAKSMDSTNI